MGRTPLSAVLLLQVEGCLVEAFDATSVRNFGDGPYPRAGPRSLRRRSAMKGRIVCRASFGSKTVCNTHFTRELSA